MKQEHGVSELRQALARCRMHFANVGLFSMFVNMLMLTSPLFMLQMYDRVLSSRSIETLVALVVLITGLFIMMGLLEYARSRVLARAGARIQDILDSRVFTMVLRRSISPAERAKPNSLSRDLDSLRSLFSGSAPFAFFDLPWTPLFLAIIFLFHPMLGFFAVGCGIVLVTLALLNQIRSREPNTESNRATMAADNMGEAMRQNAEVIQGLGMRDNAMSRWSHFREKALNNQIAASDTTGSYSSATKALRMYMQSLMLGFAGYFVIQGELSPGMMIACSIMMGRALAPIELAINNWATAQRGMNGWKTLSLALEKIPPEPRKTALPVPKGFVEAQKISVLAPGEEVPVLRGISFTIEPGQALGVIGPSGAGKSTLAKVLAGIWRPAAGKVRLDGAALDQWPTDELGRHIGYLSQDVGLFAGTVAENIARLSPKPNDQMVVEAAQRAGAHEMLLQLPQGYDTEIGYGGGRLSGGQRQRVALARALYSDPPLLILDEPNANLDAQGEQALVEAIRDAKSRGKTVVVMAHRPSAIAACDLLLMIDKGLQVDFGPRDEVLKKRTRNYPQLVGDKSAPPAAGAGAGVGASTGMTKGQGPAGGQPTLARPGGTPPGAAPAAKAPPPRPAGNAAKTTIDATASAPPKEGAAPSKGDTP
ncbi:MAG: type I secretion system permease/ATPase [Pseudomonadota bacterium]